MAKSLHQEALENAVKVLKREKNSRAVVVINQCLRNARRRAKKYQENMRGEV